MPGPNPSESGPIVEVLSRRLVRAELSNGHRLMGHSTRATSNVLVDAQLGETVVLEVSAFDLSKEGSWNKQKKSRKRKMRFDLQ